MEQEFTLYFFPSSYYSLKAYFALEEKGIPFKQRIVNIQANDQLEDWYLKINPRGEVPVLQHGTRFIADSEAIIDYIDAQSTQGPRLVPDVETGLGQEVQTLRHTLHDVPIDHITYGVMANMQFCTGKPHFPRFLINRAAAEKRLRDMLDGMKAMEGKVPPECREILSKKIKQSEERLASVLNEKSVGALLDDLEKVLDTVESHLKKSKAETGSEEYWLLGNTFTAADITAAILMFRISFLGLGERYFSATKRPIVRDYFKRLCERPAMKKSMIQSDSGLKMVMKMKAMKALKIGLLIGVVVLGVLGARELYKGRGGFRKS